MSGEEAEEFYSIFYAGGKATGGSEKAPRTGPFAGGAEPWTSGWWRAWERLRPDARERQQAWGQLRRRPGRERRT